MGRKRKKVVFPAQELREFIKVEKAEDIPEKNRAECPLKRRKDICEHCNKPFKEHAWVYPDPEYKSPTSAFRLCFVHVPTYYLVGCTINGFFKKVWLTAFIWNEESFRSHFLPYDVWDGLWDNGRLRR